MKKKIKGNGLTKYWWVGLVLLLGLIVTGKRMYSGMNQNRFCLTKHTPTTKFPDELNTAKDWLTLGDVDYESGSCDKAVKDLEMAIKLDPNYAEAYNNLGYVQMMQSQYDSALPNLNKALELRPNYPHALMNRGDIYNFYKVDKQKAMADYDQVIGLGKDTIKNESVCGHRMMAKYNGNWPVVMWHMLTRSDDTGCLRMYFEK